MRIPMMGGRLLAAVLAAGIPGAATAGAKTTSAWTAPDLKPATYAKVVVLAKFSDDGAKRILEDAVVKGLKERGINAVPAYQVLKPEDLASQEAIAAKAKELGVDGGFVFEVTEQATQVKQSSAHVSVGVGVPVSAGPFSIFLGTSVPLGGGGATPVTTVGLKSQFMVRDADGPRWIGGFSTTLANVAERAARDVAGRALKEIKKAGIFATK